MHFDQIWSSLKAIDAECFMEWQIEEDMFKDVSGSLFYGKQDMVVYNHAPWGKCDAINIIRELNGCLDKEFKNDNSWKYMDLVNVLLSIVGQEITDHVYNKTFYQVHVGNLDLLGRYLKYFLFVYKEDQGKKLI